MWIPPIPQADDVVADPRSPAGVFGDQTRHGVHPGLSVLELGEFGGADSSFRVCSEGRSVSLPVPVVLRRKVVGERGGDLDEAAPRGRRHLTGSVDDTAGPQIPVERHLDHHLTV